MEGEGALISAAGHCTPIVYDTYNPTVSVSETDNTPVSSVSQCRRDNAESGRVDLSSIFLLQLEEERRAREETRRERAGERKERTEDFRDSGK